MTPGGFNEERSATFVASAALAERCRLLNPALAEMHETVKAHRSLTAHAAKPVQPHERAIQLCEHCEVPGTSVQTKDGNDKYG